MNVEAIEKVLPAFELKPLEPGSVPMDAVLVIKCLDPEGDVRWCVRTTEGINVVETIGALDVQSDFLRTQYISGWTLE